MEQSLFIEYVRKFFGGLVLRTVKTTNGSDPEFTYLHKTMLRRVFSLTGKWEALSSSNIYVAADIVAMDSQLPLKSRGSIAKASGEIPKQGMRLQLNETQLTTLDVLAARPETEPQLIAELFQDVKKAIIGIYERNEAIFLEGLSTGFALVTDMETVGVGIRVDYKFLAANKFGASVLWANPLTSTPITDFDRIRDKAVADSKTIRFVWMDRQAFNRLAQSKQLKDMFQFNTGAVVSPNFTPTADKVNEMILSQYGWTIKIVERTVVTERDGDFTRTQPWAAGQITFTCSEQVGSLVWARLAEASRPVAGVTYQTADEYILASKYATNVPSLTEWTASQARVLPVITNTDEIYQLDTLTVQA